MNLVDLAPSWLVWAAALALVVAAIQDLLTLRISNLWPLAVLATAIAAIFVVGPEMAVWQNVVVFLSLLGIGTFLFSSGKFGGGDVKLLAATGLWFSLFGAMQLLASVFIAGGLLAVLVLGLRQMRRTTEGAKVALMRRGSGIPYGVAVATGALLTIIMGRT